jgi:serine/threonine-protein kinase
MELLDGEPLDKVLHESMKWKDAVLLAIQATHALEAAHAAGLVHRDLKPANLFLTKVGTLKLLDFGVAMALSDVPSDEKKQKGYAIFGTPEYMAPEQVAGEPVDARCDVYALGCVLYEMVTGFPPFSGKSSVEVLGKQVREAVMPPRQRAPERKIPEVLEAVVLRAMSKRREERFATAVTMRRALEDALDGDVVNEPAKKRSIALRGLVVCAVLGAIVVVSHAGNRAAPVPVAADSAHETDLPSAVPSAPDPAPLAMQAPFVTPANNAEPQSSGDKPPAKDRIHERLDQARALAQRHPSDTRALKAWTTAAVRAGDYRDARRAVDTWILHDSSPEPRVALANVLEQSGKHVEARAVLEEILETHPESDAARRLHAKLGAPLPPPDTQARRGQVARNEK